MAAASIFETTSRRVFLAIEDGRTVICAVASIDLLYIDAIKSVEIVFDEFGSC